MRDFIRRTYNNKSASFTLLFCITNFKNSNFEIKSSSAERKTKFKKESLILSSIDIFKKELNNFQ